MLVTHQLQYLHDIEHIVVMNAGQIEAQGTYEFITSKANDFSTFYDLGKSIDVDVDSHNDDDVNNDDCDVEVSKAN